MYVDGRVEISFRSNSSSQTSHIITKDIGKLTPL